MAYSRPYGAGAYGPMGVAPGAAGPPPTMTQTANPMMPGPMGAAGHPAAAAAVAASRHQAAFGGGVPGAGGAGGMMPPQAAMQAQGMTANPMLGHPAAAGGGANMMSMPPGAGGGAMGGAMGGGAYGMPGAAGFGRGASAEGPAEAEAEAEGEQEGAAEATAGQGVGAFGGASLYLVAILLPPLAVISSTGSGELLILNIVLTILGWLPGVFHAWYIISRSSGATPKA